MFIDMSLPGDWTPSLALELFFLILTSWAPIWIYSCGLYDYVEESTEAQDIGSVYLCTVATLKYAWYIVGYCTLYTLLVLYSMEETPSDNLVTWIVVVYAALVLFQMITICQRRVESDIAYRYYTVRGEDRWVKYNNPKYRRRRFSLVGRMKDYRQERAMLQQRKERLEKEIELLKKEPMTKEKRQTLKRIKTQIDVINFAMSEIDDEENDDDAGYDTPDEYDGDTAYDTPLGDYPNDLQF